MRAETGLQGQKIKLRRKGMQFAMLPSISLL